MCGVVGYVVFPLLSPCLYLQAIGYDMISSTCCSVPWLQRFTLVCAVVCLLSVCSLSLFFVVGTIHVPCTMYHAPCTTALPAGCGDMTWGVGD